MCARWYPGAGRPVVLQWRETGFGIRGLRPCHSQVPQPWLQLSLLLQFPFLYNGNHPSYGTKLLGVKNELIYEKHFPLFVIQDHFLKPLKNNHLESHKSQSTQRVRFGPKFFPLKFMHANLFFLMRVYTLRLAYLYFNYSL